MLVFSTESGVASCRCAAASRASCVGGERAVGLAEVVVDDGLRVVQAEAGEVVLEVAERLEARERVLERGGVVAGGLEADRDRRLARGDGALRASPPAPRPRSNAPRRARAARSRAPARRRRRAARGRARCVRGHARRSARQRPKAPRACGPRPAAVFRSRRSPSSNLTLVRKIPRMWPCGGSAAESPSSLRSRPCLPQFVSPSRALPARSATASFPHRQRLSCSAPTSRSSCSCSRSRRRSARSRASRMELDDCAFPLLAGVGAHRRRQRRVRRCRLRAARRARCRASRAWSAATCSRPTARIFTAAGRRALAQREQGRQGARRRQPGQHERADHAQQRARHRSAPDHRDDAARPQPRRQPARADASSVAVTSVKHMTIWGNHSATQYPDLFHCEVDGKNAYELVERPRVGRRARSSRPSPSAAPRSSRRAARRRPPRPPTRRSTTCATGRSAPTATTGSAWPSSRDGSYGVPEGLMSSLPGRAARTASTRSSRASRSTTSPAARIDASTAELAEERDAVRELGLI